MADLLNFVKQKHKSLVKKIREATQSETISIPQATVYLNELTKADDYTHLKCEELITAEPTREADIIQAHTELTEELLDLKSLLANLIHNKESETARARSRSSSPSRQRSNDVKVKLPEINLPIFDGKLDQWQSFWDQFKVSVHDRPDIPDVTKLTYLKAQLKGHPWDLVAGFSITQDSYASVISLLEATYANKDAVTDQLLRSFFSLKKPAYKADELMAFRADIEYMLCGLANLKRDIKGASWILAFCVKDKLPNQALEFIQSKINHDHPTLEQLRTHLLSVINHLNAQNSTTTSQQTSQHTSKESNSKSNSNPSGKSKPERYTASVARGNVQQKSNNLSCLFCNSDKHRSFQCTKFITRSARQEQLRKAGRCPRCCRKHDSQTSCNLRECLSCKKGKHHSYLCDEALAKLKSSQTSHSPSTTFSGATEKSNPATSAAVTAAYTSGNETSVLPVAQVGLLNTKTRKPVFHKALLDTGSQRTFIHESLATTLGLTPSSTVQLQVEGFTGRQENRTYPVVKFTIKLGRSYLRCRALITKQMPRTVTMHGLVGATNHLQHKVNLNLKHPDSDTITGIDILIGMDSYFKLVTGQTRIDGVNLLKTPGGYVIAGQLPCKYTPVNIQQNVTLVARVQLTPDPEQETLDEIHDRVTNMWNLEQLGVKPTEVLTPEEIWVEEQFKNSVTYEDGQYWVCLPWRPEHPDLLSNKAQTYYRTKNMYDKLISDPVNLNHYHQVLNKQLDQEFVELASSAEEVGHYLPHLCVKKSSTTTPLRIVYDCSAKGPNRVSLNDCLYKGPSLTEKLHSVLISFRTEPFATTADISKAFLRVGLQEQDRPYTKFFGPCQPKQFDPPQTYQFKSVLFGSTSSPYLLQAVLRHHLGNVHGGEIDSQFILDSMYVDNLQYSSTTEEEALRVCKSAQQLLSSAGMPLQEWCSNSPRVQTYVQTNPNEALSETTTSVLGIEWDILNDTLSVKTVNFTSVKTKRQLLSNCSRIYDPLGLISPITLSHKLLIQHVWTLKVTWDEELPNTVYKLWEDCLQNTKDFETLKFPRAVTTKTEYHELHVFVDASPKAYGACVYLVCPGRTPQLLQSKSRVAPREERTLPQLELTAMLLGVKLMNTVKTTLKTQPLASTTIWSDSQIALSWVLNNQSNCVYVRNRVRDIRKEFPLLNFQYVNTDDNPADFLTKPRTVSQLSRSKIWFNGPEWLSDHQIVRSNVAITHERSPTNPDPIFDYTKHNNLVSLLSVTRIVFAAIRKMRKQIQLPSPWKYWSNFVQRKHFPEEHCHMAENKSFVSRITRPALVRDLRLGFSQNDQLLVVEGRLQNSKVKPQILLPKDDHFTTLIVQFYHESNHHCGTNQTLSHVRRNFWILQGRQKVRSVLKSCYTCKRLTVSPYPVPPVPPLPEERVKDVTPFQITGIDYFGPITLQKESTIIKVYGVLFTCASVRAVHLELASDLTAETFINLFRSFVARRSCPKIIITDNATNFIAGAQNINHILSQAESKQFFLDREIEWRNIPPRAPWMGGFYERLVGVVKGSLRKALFRKRITEQELRTLLTEIEAQVNNRPLTYQTDDPQDPQALTPNHLLLGKTIDTFPICQHEEDFTPFEEHQTYNDTYRRLCKIMTHWRAIWSTDYLNSLKERKLKPKETKSASPVVAVGDICLLADNNKRREKWSLCKVLEVLPDGEGHIRIARVRVGNSEMIRAIKHLYPLESAPEDQNLSCTLGSADRGLQLGNPNQEVDLSTEKEGESSTHDSMRTTSEPDVGAAPLASVREPQGLIDDCTSQQSPQSTVNNVNNSIGSTSLGVSQRQRKQRQAARKCNAFLKKVTAVLREDDF